MYMYEFYLCRTDFFLKNSGRSLNALRHDANIRKSVFTNMLKHPVRPQLEVSLVKRLLLYELWQLFNVSDFSSPEIKHLTWCNIYEPVSLLC